MQNDPATDTLSAQSPLLVGPLMALTGVSQNQSPPTLHLASVQGNSGQVTDSYPLQVPPGPGGFQPQLALTYSSSGPNERHAATSPAADEGDGWSLSLGSISEETYGSTVWYFLNDVAGVGDRLIYNSSTGLYDTQHLSYLKIQQVTSSTTNQPCFDVWDKSGTFNEIGCTSTSLQYWTGSSGQHNYQWDVDKIVAPNEGPNASVYRLMLVTYVQDSATTNGYTTIRDAALQEIVYGTGTSTSTISKVVGTVDFFYHGPSLLTGTSDSGSILTWITPYGTNYACASSPPVSTPLRCDNPQDDGTEQAPLVMSTLTLDKVVSYVGTDAGTAPSYAEASYAFSYGNDQPFVSCTDPLTLAQEYCAGEHLLLSITPTAYQNNTGHALHPFVFGYTGLRTNTYYDSSEKVGTNHYQAQNSWQYLNFYEDLATGIGESINWQIAYSNTDGTPDDITSQGTIDGRYDPLHCATWNDCAGHYAHPDNQSWSEWVVTQISALGTDSSATALTPAATTYAYVLAKTGTYSGKVYCYPSANNVDKDCVGDNWIPKGNTDWQDYYHAEYQGFAQVWIVSPSQDLTLDQYHSTEGWYTPWSDYQNFEGGSLYLEDRYSGNSLTLTTLPLLSSLYNTYADNANACRSASATYPACEIVLTTTTSIEYNQTQHENPVSVEHSYAYDDYSASGGLNSNAYHNLALDAVTLSTVSGIYATQEYTYTPNNTVVSGSPGWTYYIVDNVTQSQLMDGNDHVWLCQNTTYDENAPSGTLVPSEGLPTTSTSYSNCASQSTSAITTYQDYDQYGNPVASIDGVASANSALYSSNGCTLLTAPVIYSSSWSNTRYTDCLTYDSASNTLPIKNVNALGQVTQQGYTTEELPNSVTDVNSRVTSQSYSYDSSGNLTTQVSQPGETNSYTTQSITSSGCTTTSVLPCAEVDTNPYLYNTVHTSTFYDSLGRAVETRTPGPKSGDDTVEMIVYNDQLHTSWQSVPFEVTHGTGWLDPNTAMDVNGVAPGGTTTFYDALGRAIATQDPSYGQGSDGIACSVTLTGTYTACVNYQLGQLGGSDLNYYATATAVDANNHVSLSFLDGLGRAIYTQQESGTYTGGATSPNQQTSYAYNVLNEVTQVQVSDLAPQSGQSLTSVTTSVQYDDLGRLTQLVDPDRGTHTYTYDNDGNVSSDISGTRTIGYSHDLLGRLGCAQDQLPTQNVTGACTSGATPYVVNTYDTSQLGTQGSTDFPIGQLTESVTTTRYSANTSATVAQLYQHDQRGQLIDEQVSFPSLPSSWNVTSALPSYLAQYLYNDANQLVTTTTSTNPSGQGYTSSQSYDPTTGVLTGLTTGASTLASLLYNARAQLDTITFQTSSGSSALMTDQFGYDANLRPTSTTATWQSGSGNSGTAYSQSRSYDPASNLISLTTSLPAVPGYSGSGGSMTENFCYDEQNRLVWAGNSGSQPAPGAGTCGSGALANTLGGANYTSSYVSTHLGQLWQGPRAGGSSQYQYLYCNSSQPHQLTGLYALSATCASKTGVGYKSSYDAYGNVTSRTYAGTTATLSYDLFDHLTQWNVSSNNQEQYAYDASGNRVLRRSTNGSVTTLTVYAFGLEDHVYSGAGTNQGNTYYYSLAGHLIGALDSSGTTFYLTDALGSILTSFTNASGSSQVKGEQDYMPYGPSRYTQGSLNTAKGYTGQYNDSLTGLDYYGARYYDPVVGVFLSADSVQGNAQGMNPYGYVGGNPETWSDPTGQFLTPKGEGGAEAVVNIGPSETGGVTVPDAFQNAFEPGQLDPTSSGTASGSTDNLTWSVTSGDTTTYYSGDSSGSVNYWVYRNGVLVGGGDASGGGGSPLGINGAVLAGLGIKLNFPDTGSTPVGGAINITPHTLPGGGGQGGKPPFGNRTTTGQFPDEPPGNGKLPIDLFRRGNSTSPKVDNVRIPGASEHPDVFPDENGTICPNQGGISTFESPQAGKWWRLPAGTELPEGLQLRNDHGTHWLIEPSEEMTVDTFSQLLGSIVGWEPCF